MRSKRRQNKFVRFITIPARVLRKARDLYVRSLMDYARGARYSNAAAGLPAGEITALPKSFSVLVSSSCRSNDDVEDYGELVRAASVRSMGHANEAGMFLQQQQQQHQQHVIMRRPQWPPPAVAGSKGFPKSCSVGMGFMSRIDEERASDLGEEDRVGSGDNNNNSKRSIVFLSEEIKLPSY